MPDPQPSTIPRDETNLFMCSELGPLRSIKSTTSTGISILRFTSTYTSTSTTSSYFHKQSFFPDIKPLQLSHIPFISVAGFGANIRRVLAEQLSQFHSYQSFTNAGNDAPISLPTVTNAGSSTTLVLSDGEEGSRDDRSWVGG
ncbi:hypothetical protein BCR33DRAFT_793902 [Rhizoclosmatium globosum]|uniref:Uncharacterized protein n=1 Tax=Rhizoclosmatium globosum TaxID=329046 RepID=A0A1Y2AXI6_9FUNG|nr:hypothetical protein BCR33DRAFT_793902 [Rhizoclosmatium globosum]|eukprot:ORY27272.1 hypothetical protein BCR33DRAFT_793902 [Rhizoclosmatium globosum]